MQDLRGLLRFWLLLYVLCRLTELVESVSPGTVWDGSGPLWLLRGERTTCARETHAGLGDSCGFNLVAAEEGGGEYG